MLSSSREDWCTPQHIIDLVLAIMPEGKIDLDPCSNAHSIVPALVTADGVSMDGLESEWFTSTVYVNPPYGRAIGKWTRKCALEAKEWGNTIVALVPARTDTRWFQEAMRTADGLVLLSGRIKFLGAKHGAPFPSALIVWGDCSRLKAACAGRGLVFIRSDFSVVYRDASEQGLLQRIQTGHRSAPPDVLELEAYPQRIA